MTAIFFLEALEKFIKEQTKNIILEVETRPGADKKERPAEVHKMRLPKKEDAIKRIPYILLQLLKGKDEVEESGCMVRIVVATYSEDGSAGSYDLLNVILKIKAELERVGMLENRYVLHYPVEWLIYPEDNDPYFFGEMITNWSLPIIKREVEEVWQE